MKEKVYESISGIIFGKEITLSGLAYNAKGGAVVKLKEDIVYIQGLDYWPSESIGKKISIKGKLQEKKFIPDPVIAKDGAISQGAYGNQYVLENAKWEKGKKP